MKTPIIRIGNSKGVRIPKVMLEQAKMHDEVDLRIQGHQIIIQPVRKTREGWDEAFRSMAEHGDDQLLDKNDLAAQSSWDIQEWEW